MKTPVIIWQKPEYKKSGKVKVAVLVSPTQFPGPEEMPGMIMF